MNVSPAIRRAAIALSGILAATVALLSPAQTVVADGTPVSVDGAAPGQSITALPGARLLDTRGPVPLCPQFSPPVTQGGSQSLSRVAATCSGGHGETDDVEGGSRGRELRTC